MEKGIDRARSARCTKAQRRVVLIPPLSLQALADLEQRLRQDKIRRKRNALPPRKPEDVHRAIAQSWHSVGFGVLASCCRSPVVRIVADGTGMAIFSI